MASMALVLRESYRPSQRLPGRLRWPELSVAIQSERKAPPGV